MDFIRKKPTWQVRALRVLAVIRRRMPILERLCLHIGAAIINSVLHRDRRCQGIGGRE